MTITEHADAILDAACAAPLSRHGWTNAERQAILAACQALHDEGMRAGIEAAAKVCKEGAAVYRKRSSIEPNKRNARDYESMAIACVHTEFAIRAIDIAKLGEV